MNAYQTVARPCRDELVIQKSRFIAELAPARNEAQALCFVKSARQKYPGAKHHCYGFTLFQEKIGRSHDDGEPAGTAGSPIFRCLTNHQLYDCVLVVTRYFGGILLGAGGLTRAYGGAAELAIKQAERVTMRWCVPLTVTIPYALLEPLERYISACPALLCSGADYQQDVTLSLSVWEEKSVDVFDKIQGITRKKAVISQTNPRYLPWKS